MEISRATACFLLGFLSVGAGCTDGQMEGTPKNGNTDQGAGGNGNGSAGAGKGNEGGGSTVGSNKKGGSNGGGTETTGGSSGNASGTPASKNTGGSAGASSTLAGDGEKGGGAGSGNITGLGGNGRVGGAAGNNGKGATGGSAGLGGKGGGDSAGSMGGGGKNTGVGGGSGAGGATTTVAGDCSFTIKSAKPSTAIATVGVVEWSTSLGKVDEASIEFKLQDAAADELNTGGVAPVDLTQANYKTLLLGLKGERSYKYRISAKSGSTTCASDEYDFDAGAVATSVPTVKRTVSKAAARTKGFIITAGGMGSGGGGMAGGGAGGMGGGTAMIIDADGEVVWWAEAPSSCSRAIQSYDGTTMWMAALNMGTGGEVRSVSMDGLTVQKNVSGLSGTHHDITAAPGGVVTCLSWSGVDKPSDVIEHSPDGTNKTIFTLDSKFYQPSGSQYHANAIHYVAVDDSYTISDRYANMFIKVKRSSGQVMWQLGGSCTNAKTTNCVAGTWQVNHGHHLVGDGKFLFFNNGNMGGGSTVYEYTLTETGTFSAKQNWSYSASGASSSVLGDVQRLPNGNTLVTFSNQGVIHEIDSSQQLVQTLSVGTLGYADFRESLYGEPTRK